MRTFLQGGTRIALLTWLGLGAINEVAASPAPAPALASDPATPQRITPVMACTMQGIGSRRIVTDAATTIIDVSSNTTADNGTPYCLVKVKVAEAINIWVTLPLDGHWNGRLRSQGGGMYAGVVNADEGAASLGYIGVQTDTGHDDATGLGLDGSFGMAAPGMANQKLQEDFAYRSMHLMAVVAKQLAKHFYGQEPMRSYWYGCSTGGRQGVMMAQRYPDDYDGILAGAPAIHWDRLQANLIWPQVVMHQDLDGHVLSAGKQALATASAVAACDASDGVEDGLLADPRSCSYDPTTDVAITRTSCTTADDTCLSPAEAGVMQKIWRGSTTAFGHQVLWPGVERGADTTTLAGASPFPLATEHPKYWVYFDPDWDWKTLTQESFGSYFMRSAAQVGPLLATDNPDLSAFRAKGGKLIVYHGWEDPVVFPQGSVKYFDALNSRTSDQSGVEAFARLFMVPGMAHCGGGDGPNSFGQFEPEQDADHDVFKALVRWVEHRVAPTRIIATKYLDDEHTNPVLRTRPLCVYPAVARYSGSGSIDDAENFSCVAP